MSSAKLAMVVFSGFGMSRVYTVSIRKRQGCCHVVTLHDFMVDGGKGGVKFNLEEMVV